MSIRAPNAHELASIRDLLARSGLPTADLDTAQIDWLVSATGAQLDGVAGIEAFGDVGLLRSLAVAPAKRNAGVASALVRDVESHARARGITQLVLLTQTAEKFFAARGYRPVARDAVPPALQASAEFRSLCPASATCMSKPLAVKRVLFVCVENSNRSQMAEAFARLHGGAAVEALSAGSRPSGQINPRAVRFMAELGYDLAKHASKSLGDIGGAFDAVVTMGCGDACPWVPAVRREDWALPDPKHMDDAGYRGVRDEISSRVKTLLADL